MTPRTCPRCHEQLDDLEDEYYGPCRWCRMELRSKVSSWNEAQQADAERRRREAEDQ